MNARDCDPFADDDITQGEFEEAMTANFPTITIPDPAAVGAWLDEQQPGSFPARVSYTAGNMYCVHWPVGNDCVIPYGATPDELLVNLRAKIAERDPVAKLAKDAAEAGYSLTPIPKHIPAP